MNCFLFLTIATLFGSSGLAQSAIMPTKFYELSTNDREGCNLYKYRPLKISHLLTKTVKEVEPKYPLAAKTVKASGRVIVQIVVNRKGNVIRTCILEGHPLLRSSAVQAAKEWKFKKDFGFSPKFKPRKRYVETELIFNFELPK